MHIKEKVLRVESAYENLFMSTIKFSSHLIKCSDEKVKDKYDHNSFIYLEGVTDKEIELAINDQKDKGFKFIKFRGNYKLNLKNFIDDSNYLMLYSPNKNKKYLKKGYSIKSPTYNEILNIELKHYGKKYGSDFIIRSLNEEFNKLVFHGLYFKSLLVGYCYTFSYKGYTMLDGLLIDEKYRHQGLATMLLKYLSNSHTYLHAYIKDSVVSLYKKLGFKIVDIRYEYLKKIRA